MLKKLEGFQDREFKHENGIIFAIKTNVKNVNVKILKCY